MSVMCLCGFVNDSSTEGRCDLFCRQNLATSPWEYENDYTDRICVVTDILDNCHEIGPKTKKALSMLILSPPDVVIRDG